ncbi:hypothetical protein RRG08_033051 [Elysia crispata]|uniref:Uncharacterized protein n=1 Tax=Elysia crispata TaxID=231223 RepID=A0AAE1A7J6_9GAST|nr:hypothetical protein RRG08_033051 [Elysia crispata]
MQKLCNGIRSIRRPSSGSADLMQKLCYGIRSIRRPSREGVFLHSGSKLKGVHKLQPYQHGVSGTSKDVNGKVDSINRAVLSLAADGTARRSAQESRQAVDMHGENTMPCSLPIDWLSERIKPVH